MKRALLLLVLAVSLGCISAWAQPPLIVYSNSPSWLTNSSLNGSNPSFVLPAVTPCGGENGNTCEPYGGFFFNQTWAGAPSYISMTEAGGGPSDIITFDSLGPNGAFRVLFFSDPSLPGSSFYVNYIHYTDIQEDPVAGGVGGPFPVCCILNGNFLNVTVASDGESYFDPFGYGFDTSDGIKFDGAIYGGQIPEPTSLLLLGSGVLGAFGVVRRRFLK